MHTLALLFALTACNTPTDAAPEMTPAAAVPEAAPAAPAAPALPALPEGNSRALIAEGSSLSFVGAKITAKHEGGFKNIEGTAVTTDAGVVGAKLIVSTQSTWADHPKLEEHLKNADFFDTEKFPVATFVGNKVTEGGKMGATHTIEGMLDFHGKVAPLSFPVTITQEEGQPIHVVGNTLVNRHDWGVSYPGMPDNLIKDAVQVSLDLKFQ